jgi:glycosyltransferase involved in cell wall biosynthesis
MLASPATGLIQRGYRIGGMLRFEMEMKRYQSTISNKLEYFGNDKVPGIDPFAAGLPSADITHLHFVAGFVDYQKFFKRWEKGRPLVWTLHDMNPFTGGCHYSLGCDRFEIGCGACHLLGSTDENDFSARAVKRKKAAFDFLSPDATRIIAPSRWLAKEARASSLLGRFDVKVVPHGLDTETFSPRDRALAREVFGLPQNAKVILFGATSSNNYRKGFDLAVAAVRSLEDRLPKGGAPLVLASIGELSVGKTSGISLAEFGYLGQDRLLSYAYSAADIFVMPSREEAFGQVAIEAMSCAIPVVSFDLGGAQDIVRNGETGFLVEPENVEMLSEAIAALLKDPNYCEAMGRRARKVAVEEYGLETFAQRTISLYDEILRGTPHIAGNLFR